MLSSGRLVSLALLAVTLSGCCCTTPSATPVCTQTGPWQNSPIGRCDFFPIAVWCQEPDLANQYKAMGVNTFVSLWNGPTEEQLATLSKAGLYVICTQNDVGLKHLADPTIIGWMHDDEPDNRQATGHAVPLATILDGYRRMRTADPTRPVYIGFGQGVANDLFPSRALPYEQYADYAKGADIVSYDVYPVSNIKEPGADGKIILRSDGVNFLWYVAKGIDRLHQWTDNRKRVWNALECTHIGNPDHIATPDQVRSEVWMSLIHGSTGIVWFVHDFRPDHRDIAAVLKDPEMFKALAQINRQIAELAPVLNSPTHPDLARVTSSSPDVPIDIMVKRDGDTVYVFAVGMRNAPAGGQFQVMGLGGHATAQVIGENRTIDIAAGKFSDSFTAYQVHLYKITPQP